MNEKDFARRLDALIAAGDSLASQYQTNRAGESFVAGDSFAEFRATGLSLLTNLCGERHAYFTEFEKQCKMAYLAHTKRGVGILRSARAELADGWFQSTKGIVSAEIFADFTEMAEHLLDEGYKDAAAVMIGGVLEGHLKRLAAREGIATEQPVKGVLRARKADSLNADLTGAAVYDKLDQKAVTSWLDLRNKAAHADYGAYTKEQVALMLAGVRNFIVRVPG